METNSTELRRRQNDARKNIPHRHSRRCPEQFREHLFRIQRDIERAMVEGVNLYTVEHQGPLRRAVTEAREFAWRSRCRWLLEVCNETADVVNTYFREMVR